ncbi:MAG: hypothetical protein ACI9MR_001011, partial [Myxococcota bacterium]
MWHRHPHPQRPGLLDVSRETPTLTRRACARRGQVSGRLERGDAERTRCQAAAWKARGAFPRRLLDAPVAALDHDAMKANVIADLDGVAAL